MNPIFVTGASGFVGSHLSPLCPSVPFKGDVRDIEALKHQIASVQPSAVIHLAAQSNVGYAFQNPQETHAINFLGTINLINALRAANFKGRMLFISSADVYAEAKEPLTETHPCKALNPYAESKLAAEKLCLEETAFDIMIARPFNHIGPRQSPLFAVPSFAKQLKSISRGESPPLLRVGNLKTTRDFCDVRDVVRGYLLLLEKGEKGSVYNLCSGQEYLIEDILQRLIALSNIEVTLEQDSNLVRSLEQKRVLGSFAKIYKDTGWKPEISLAQSLQDIWEHA